MELLVNGPPEGRKLILAHGAGAPMDSEFMEDVAGALGDRGVRVIRFEFPYMAERRTSGKRRGPDRAPRLLESWREVVQECGNPAETFIGGKSMGGRMATMIADELGVRGVSVFGYPFHPPGNLERVRTEHLKSLRTPTLIVQGERDLFGTRAEVDAYELSTAISIEWMPDGDHSFAPRKSSGITTRENLQRAIEAVARFVLVR